MKLKILAISVAGLALFSVWLTTRSAPQIDNLVKIAGFAYGPAKTKIKAGETVMWENEDGVGHTITAADGTFESGMLNRNNRIEVKFDKPGTFAYYCKPHPYMRGTVTIGKA